MAEAQIEYELLGHHVSHVNDNTQSTYSQSHILNILEISFPSKRCAGIYCHLHELLDMQGVIYFSPSFLYRYSSTYVF